MDEVDWKPLEQFWRRWRRPALQVARRFVYPRDADDLVADAMIRLTRRYASAPLTPETLFPYLCRIIHRLAIDKYRRKRVVECEYTLDMDPRICCDQYRNGDDADVAMILATVTPIYRSAMICVDVEEMSYAETAKILGISSGTVRSRLHRGRAMARPAMEKMLEERRKAI
jgi:RNA polymerase sigma factor (sigma-70 family)